LGNFKTAGCSDRSGDFTIQPSVTIPVTQTAANMKELKGVL